MLWQLPAISSHKASKRRKARTHTTRYGRVVYERSKHTFTDKDLFRIFRALISNSPDPVQYTLQVIRLELDLSAGIAVGSVDRLARELWYMVWDWIRTHAGSLLDEIRDLLSL
jgi:hypothetical protein